MNFFERTLSRRSAIASFLLPALLLLTGCSSFGEESNQEETSSLDYSITGVDVVDLPESIDSYSGKLAIIKIHIVNSGTMSRNPKSERAYFQAYQNNNLCRRFDLTDEEWASIGYQSIPDILDPKCEMDEPIAYQITNADGTTDMSPLRIHLNGRGAGSNDIDQTLYLRS